ncbi:LGFP repeat-containing protein [Archangium lipolyticum]|uniref:LGFP repeat-containing protein n=1 Tax=Archangium lipolyticum TaxID=2970465 RepID=UPI00214A0829|nr:hypothetical protein [Archangium lipolyticum]
MSAIDTKYSQLGGSSGLLGAPKTPETTCPDGVGRFRHYAFGSIYWSPDSGAHEIHGAIRNRWAQLGWEKGFLGYPKTDETKTPDQIGRFNHFQHGSIYWKPTLSAHEVHGLIRSYWAEHGWEKNPDLGYPISDELPAAEGSKNRYSDFENGVLYWRYGETKAVELSKMVLGNASKTASEVLEEIKKIAVPLMTQKVDGHQLYITSGPTLCGPEPLGSPINPAEYLKPVTDYSFNGQRVMNRLYKVHTALGIEVSGSADISASLELQIEVFFDKKTRTVNAAPRKWWISVHVPWPTSWGVSADEIVEQFKKVVGPEINKVHEIAKVPEGINILSVKTMPNGDLNVYMEPLL